MKKLCIITNSKNFKGGITAVVSGYHGSKLEEDYNVKYVESCSDSKNKIVKVGKMLEGYIQFVWILFTFRPDIVHVNSSFGFSFYRKLFYIYLSKLFSIKIVNHIHGAEFERFFLRASKSKKRRIVNAYNTCDHLIALSEEWKNNLSQIVSEDKIEVIENYSIIHTEDVVIKDGTKVLFLGEIGKRKGCLDIPDVIFRVTRILPKCKFILAGNIIENDFKLISEKIHDYGIEGNVEFAGWVRGEKKDKLLKECDLFFLPSYNEGMPMSILDAMGYGLPIVSTTIGGIPKIVKNGENGFIFPPGDVESFANAIVSILKNANYRHDYGEKSLEIIREGYSLNSHIEKLEKLYNSILVEGSKK